MASDMFFKIGDIKGESGDAAHKEEIEVMSFSYGATQTGTSSAGSGHGSGKVSLSDLHFVKKVDKSSPVLFVKCCTGEHIKDAQLVVRKAGGTQLEYLKIKLTDVTVSSVRPGGSAHGDDIPMEEVSLNFTKIDITYQQQGADGKAQGGPVSGGWNLKTNVKS